MARTKGKRNCFAIRKRRKEIGMSQGELCERSGVCRSTLSLLENGYTVDVRVSTLFAIAGALKCSIGSLFE